MNKNDSTGATPEQRLILTAMLISGFASTVGVGMFSFAVPLLSLDDKVSGFWLGSAFAGYYLAKLLASPVSGMLADRIGARKVLLGAALVGVIVPLLYLIDNSIAVLSIVQFAMGLVSGLLKPLGQAVLGGTGDREKLSSWFSWHALAFNVALFASPLLSGLLYSASRIDSVLLGLSLCMAVTTLAVAFLLPDNVKTRVEVSDEEQGRKRSSAKAASLFLAIAGRALGIGLVTAFYPILLATTLGRSGVVSGAVFAVPSFMVCLGLPVIGRLFKGGPKALPVVVGMLISAGALFALGAGRELWHFVIFGGLMGVGAAISIPSSMALASELSPSQGKVFGMAHLAAGIGFLVGPLLGGVVIQNYHLVGMALQAAALIGACTCMPLLFHAIREQLDWGRKAATGATVLCLILLAVFGALQLLPESGGKNVESGLYEYSDVAMGTIVKLTLKAESRTAADDASRKVLAAMRSIQRDFDHRAPDGSIGRINRGAGEYWVSPTTRAYDLIRRSLAFSKQTGGVFDPTIGALTTSPMYYALDESIAASRKGLVDYRLVDVRESDNHVRLSRKGMALDLGGIAKGAIIDMAVGLLRAQGIAAGIVEAGGDFYCFGDRDWTVGIRNPREDAVYATIAVREKGVCGSGDYQQFVINETGGEMGIQHHIIDPEDMTSADKSAGVTVIADNAEQADMLATALFVMGPKQGKRFMEEYFPDADAMWFRPDLSVVVTDSFPQ